MKCVENCVGCIRVWGDGVTTVVNVHVWKGLPDIGARFWTVNKSKGVYETLWNLSWPWLNSYTIILSEFYLIIMIFMKKNVFLVIYTFLGPVFECLTLNCLLEIDQKTLFDPVNRTSWWRYNVIQCNWVKRGLEAEWEFNNKSYFNC